MTASLKEILALFGAPSQTFGLAGPCLAKPSQLRSEFFELETLGPFGENLRGEALVHPEAWVVFSGVSLPSREGIC